MGVVLTGACNAPVAQPVQASGEAVAFGAGAGGAPDACFTCHGLKGEGDGPIPRLAGLSTGYLVKQLEDYAGRWRDDPSMSPIAARMTDADRLAVAGYYSAREVPDAVPNLSDTIGSRLFRNGDPGRSLKSCASCHDVGAGEGGQATPTLSGQTTAYVKAQLLAFKDSRRRNDPRDVMGKIARRLTMAEIESLALHVGATK